MLEKSNGGVKLLKVSHLDAFLQELYFHTTSNSYQSSAWGYSTVPNRPLTKGLKTFPASTKAQKAEKRRPVQLFLADFSHNQERPSINDMRSTSWASLAGMCFINSLEGYTIIRIDLENHHTVEGIIAEFFKLVRVVDPQAPSCAISNMDDSVAAGTIIAKAVQRIFDVFKRGRYVLILDLVESFGRPQMVHHGMLSSKITTEDKTEDKNDHADQCRADIADTNSTGKTKSEEERFNDQASNLRIFINELLGFDHKNDPLSPNRYWDSYVLVTADKPRHRHLVPGSESTSYDVIKTHVIEPLKELIKYKYHHIYIYKQDQASSTTNNKYANLIADDFLPDSGDPSNNLAECWKQFYNPLPIPSAMADQRSLDRTHNVLTLLNTFRGGDDVRSKVEKLSQLGTIGAFICLLSIFRRPRALPLLRSMIERWGLRQIGDFNSDEKNEVENKDSNKSIVPEKDAMKTHQAIDELLQLIAISPQAKNKTGSDKACQETSEAALQNHKRNVITDLSHDLQEPLVVTPQNNGKGNDSTDKKDESQGALGVVSQNHEGGIVWLFREVYEASYDALTENIHSNAWIEEWKKKNNEPLSSTAAIMDGTLSIIWHLFAARSYYVDVFLATHDMRAFWEYLYHRVSAIRVITLLITIIEKENAGDNNNSIWDELNKHCKTLRHQNNTEQLKYKNLPDNSDFEENHFVWYAWVLGIFDPIKQDVGENLKQLTDAEQLKWHFKILRKNSLNTLLMAIKKNKLLFRIEAAPDSVLAWSRQFIKSELNNMQEVSGYPYEKEGPETCIGDTVKELLQLFTRLKTQALCSKMDYKAILKDCCGLDLPAEYDSNEFKQRLEKKRNCFKFVIYFLKSDKIEEVVNGAINQAGPDSFENLAVLLSEENKNDLNIALIENDKDKITEKLHKIIFDNAKKQLNDLFNIALCLVEPCDTLAEEHTGFILSQLNDIGRSNSDQVNNWVKKSMLRAYELSCRALFKEWTFWQPLLERGDSYSNKKVAEEKKKITALLKAESHSVLYENLLRETTETNTEDVKHRSTALTIRARALYLRGHFPQAHHFIDLASAGLFPDRIEHWTLISVMHIVRAELLAISANEHYFSFSEHDQVKKKLIEQGFIEILDKLNNTKKPKIEAMALKDLPLRNFPEELQYFSTIAKILEPIAASSLKKIDRAESELHNAEKLLRSMAHQSNWLIYMEFGLAQVQIEKMLFEMELLFLSRRPLTVTEYLKKSGKLEQKILDAMQRLRNILDIIPYDSRQLNDIDENERSAGRSMFKLECNTFKLWRQLYVVGSFYSSLLNRLYGHDQPPRENPTIFKVTEEFLEDCFNNTLGSYNGMKYSAQWKLWCTAMRFERFGDDDNMGTFKFQNPGKKNTLKYLSFGVMVIDVMGKECAKAKIEKMWCIRRDQKGKPNPTSCK
ncbi:MAG: hypothetical protein NTV43_09230 [Methylococcales bacterium]|nr:hypothetical protein [Methylococcales bacterium]